jgi:hypothetical protein
VTYPLEDRRTQIAKSIPPHDLQDATAASRRRGSRHRVGWGSMSAAQTAWNNMPIGVLTSTPTRRSAMTNKPTIPTDTKKKSDIVHPGMMGDGTEEQNLDEVGNPAARIKKDDVEAAFGKKNQRK